MTMGISKFDKRVNAFDNVSAFNIILAKVINILLTIVSWGNCEIYDRSDIER